MSSQQVIGYMVTDCAGGSVPQDCSLNGVCNNGWFLQDNCGESGNYNCCCIPGISSINGNTCPPGNTSNVCPNLQPGVSVNAFIPDPQSCSGQTTCRIGCAYKASDFFAPNQVANFINAFGSDPASLDSMNTFLMPQYCIQPVSTCPPDPQTGITPKTCSRMISTDPSDQYCRQWVNNTNYAPVIEGTMNVYCTNSIGPTGTGPNGSTVPSECICVARAYDPLYEAMQFGQGYADACWWKPCQIQSSYLIPPQYAIAPGTCPSSICSQAINAYNDNNINISFPDSNFFISCNFGGNTGQPPSPQPNFLNNLFEFIREHEVWFIIGVIVIIVVVVLIVWASSRSSGSGGNVAPVVAAG